MKSFLVIFLALFFNTSLVFGHGEAPHVAKETKSISPSKKSKKVSAKFDFIYKDFPGKIELYEVSDSSVLDITETRVVANKKDLPVKKKMTSLTMSPGEARTFVLVVENKTNTDWYFNATPHSITPIEASVGQKFECLCNHSIFKAQKKAFWYRIVRFEIEKDFSSASIRLTHNILGVKSEDAKDKYKDILYNM